MYPGTDEHCSQVVHTSEESGIVLFHCWSLVLAHSISVNVLLSHIMVPHLHVVVRIEVYHTVSFHDVAYSFSTQRYHWRLLDARCPHCCGECCVESRCPLSQWHPCTRHCCATSISSRGRGQISQSTDAYCRRYPSGVPKGAEIEQFGSLH